MRGPSKIPLNSICIRKIKNAEKAIIMASYIHIKESSSKS